MEDPVVPLERNLYGHSLVGLMWERQFEEVLVKFQWETYRIGNVCLFMENNSYFSVYVDDYKMAGKRQNLASMWKKLMKNIDLDEPTSFLDHVCSRCTQRECRPDEIVIEKCKEMFESRISAGQLKITRMAKTSRKNCSVVLRHGRTCSKMRGKVLRIGEQKDRATVQSFKQLFGRSPNQKGRA